MVGYVIMNAVKLSSFDTNGRGSRTVKVQP